MPQSDYENAQVKVYGDVAPNESSAVVGVGIVGLSQLEEDILKVLQYHHMDHFE